LFLVEVTLANGISCAFAEHEVDIAHTAAGQLKVEIEFQPPLVLRPSVFPGIIGYATGEVGFHSVIFDDPTNDSFQLSTDADFRFILVARDPGMEVWNDHGSAYMTNGESFYIGVPPFDTHPVWNIVSGVPGNNYSLTLKLRDLNSIYPDSAPFTLSFTPIAPPQLAIADNHDGTITVTFTASPEEEYVVQVASALGAGTVWTNVSTNTAGTDGTWTYTESTTNQTQRFYRAVIN